MNTLKYIFNRTLIAFLVVSIASCDLDEYNPSGVPTDDLWSTPEGFITAVNGAYSEQRSLYGKDDGIFMFESGTDLWFNKEKNGFARQITKYDGLSAADGNPHKQLWKYFYSAINMCNAGLSHIDKAGFTNPEERNKREGELRFLRGFYYWHLVEQYGDLILRTKETTGPELTATRTPVEECYNLIIDDLTFAANNLPNSWGNEYSRATKKAALGFLARAYLSRAYYATGSARDEFFTKARNTAQEVIDRKTEFNIALWDKYADLWVNPTNNKKLGKDGGEALYVVSNSSANPGLSYDNQGNRSFHHFQNPYVKLGFPALGASVEYGFEDNGRLMPTLALLNFFNESIDSRYEASFQEVWLANKPFKWDEANRAKYGKDASVINRELRVGVDTALYITKKKITNAAQRPYVVMDKYTVYSNTDSTIKTGVNYINMKKFMDPNRPTAATAAGFNDVIVMRLAEMYMIVAEAEFQLGHSAEAAESINVIRRRAAKKTPVDHTAAMEITAADVSIDFILDEYAREFAGEWKRWFDLKRTGKLYERVKKYNPDITKIQEFHSLRPIPITEITNLINGSEFKNNTGY